MAATLIILHIHTSHYTHITITTHVHAHALFIINNIIAHTHTAMVVILS
jgi:hypothetical protein